jgi:hypothetical protein
MFYLLPALDDYEEDFPRILFIRVSFHFWDNGILTHYYPPTKLAECRKAMTQYLS